jgi:hypothetical protein
MQEAQIKFPVVGYRLTLSLFQVSGYRFLASGFFYLQPLPVQGDPLGFFRHPLPVQGDPFGFFRHPLPVQGDPLGFFRHLLPVQGDPLGFFRHLLPVQGDPLGFFWQPNHLSITGKRNPLLINSTTTNP